MEYAPTDLLAELADCLCESGDDSYLPTASSLIRLASRNSSRPDVTLSLPLSEPPSESPSAPPSQLPSQPPSQPPSESPSEASSPLEHSRLARRWLKGIQTKTPGETPSMIDLTLLVNKIQQQPDEFSPTSVVAGLDYPASSSCLCACPVRPCPPE